MNLIEFISFFLSASVLALQEFSKLQDKVDFEMTLKQEAENFAHKVK